MQHQGTSPPDTPRTPSSPTTSFDLARLGGTRASGTLRVSEQALNAMLAAAPASRVPVVSIGAGNRMTLRVDMVHAHLTLGSHVTLRPTPRLSAVLDSQLVAWGLKALVRQPFLRVDGRTLLVDLGAVPEIAAHQRLWTHVQHIGMSTTPGLLLLQFTIELPRIDKE